VQTFIRLTAGLTLALCAGVSLHGCKARAGTAEVSAPGGSDSDGESLLSKEEVGAILGQPVTSLEGRSQDRKYKTDLMFIEASIEVERKRDAVASMVGARKATAMLGGTPEAVPNLGDDAFFGAMSMLYVRKGDSFAIIQAPNYAQQAQADAMTKVQAARTPEETGKAMAELVKLSKNDPTQAGLQGGDATKGAMAVVNASSRKQGTPDEERQRGVAVALARKLMEKL
jgi:hypothetical protein